MVAKGDMLVLFLIASALEIFGGLPKVIQLFNLEAAAAPGDYMFDPLGLGKGAAMDRMKLAEIKVRKKKNVPRLEKKMSPD
jgi:hypothetical protein